MISPKLYNVARRLGRDAAKAFPDLDGDLLGEKFAIVLAEFEIERTALRLWYATDHPEWDPNRISGGI